MPAYFPSPYTTSPHEIALEAAEIVQYDLVHDRRIGHDFFQPSDGKMVGVLVVEDRYGSVGFLRAVSGRLGGKWLVDGYAPPLFDVAARDKFWPAGQLRLDEIGNRADALSGGPIQELRRKIQVLTARGVAEEAELAAELTLRKANRASKRAALSDDLSPAKSTLILQQISEESQFDRKTRKAARKQRKQALDKLSRAAQELETQRLGLKRERTDVSNHLLTMLQAGYCLVNAAGQRRSLTSIFEPLTPPGGSGDCAAPKLLGYANQHNMRPIALAEFWWGTSPIGTERYHGHYYPPCRRRCRKILSYMLQGISVI